MGRPKGGKNRYWSKEEKLRIVKKVVEDNCSSKQVAREENINDGMLTKWVKVYLQHGIAGLENKKKPGNPLSKYANRKELSEIEQLEYENMKLRIENERLKKGYWVEGDGQIVVFNGSKNKNLK